MRKSLIGEKESGKPRSNWGQKEMIKKKEPRVSAEGQQAGTAKPAQLINSEPGINAAKGTTRVEMVKKGPPYETRRSELIANKESKNGKRSRAHENTRQTKNVGEGKLDSVQVPRRKGEWQR